MEGFFTFKGLLYNSTMLISEKTAVTVLDMQNDFCASDGAFAQHLGWDPKPIQKMVPRLARFISAARDSGALIVFSKMINDAEESPKNLRKHLAENAEKNAGQWPFALQPNSRGSELYLLQPQPIDIVLNKYYYDIFSNPEYTKILKERNIDTNIITGVYREVCVFASGSRAFTEGYNVYVPRDLTASVAHRLSKGNAVLKIMGGYCAHVVNSTDFKMRPAGMNL